MTQELTLSNYIIVRYEYEFEVGLPAVFYHVQEQEDLSRIKPWTLDEQKTVANKTAKTSPWDKAILSAIDCQEKRVKECNSVPKDAALLYRDQLVKSVDLKKYRRLNVMQTSDTDIVPIVTGHVVNYYQANKHTSALKTYQGKTTHLRDMVVDLLMTAITDQGEWISDANLEKAFSNALAELNESH